MQAGVPEDGIVHILTIVCPAMLMHEIEKSRMKSAAKTLKRVESDSAS